MDKFKEEYKYDLECDPQSKEYTAYVTVNDKKITISEREMVKIARWELGMTQDDFYSQVCDQQAGSLFEKTYKRHEDQDQDHIFDVVNRTYNIFPDENISVGFIARLLRQRAKESVDDAAEHVCKSRVWVMHAEKNLYDPHILIEIYSFTRKKTWL